MQVLESFLGGRWQGGRGEGSALFDPTTGAPIAHASSVGLELGAALRFARTRGGPGLRAMSFAQRAAMLTAVANAIHAHRDELLQLAAQNGGNTRGDAKFDIDGCTTTIAHYAKLGAALGEQTVLADGEIEALSRNPRYVGRHVRLPREGVAIHINAFNFPAWGFGEKAAVAWLAGLPVFVKPATSTALVAHRIGRILCDAAVLPEGALSLLCGSAGDLLDHVGPQDAIAFTGSADTGVAIRGHRQVLASSVAVNIEADSLNAAVLGPDVEEGGDAWDMMVREAARDLSQKAGQKCTAIRRIFVPRALAGAFAEALTEELRRVQVGDPRHDAVTMGPLATAQQQRDVRAGIAQIAPAGRFVFGDGGEGNLVGAEPGRGYFVGPTVLLAESADLPHVHEREVFGPFQVVMPYDGGAGDAAAWLARGGGSLLSSVYTDDEAFARDCVRLMGPWLGRIHIGGGKVREHSPGPGTVLPQMTHGGPGRAGGGEELGGLRAVEFYCRRLAVQGSKPWLERLAGA